MILPRMALRTEQLRRLAVDMTLYGDAPAQVAELLAVSERSVWRWLSLWKSAGDAGLAPHPGRGRPPKLNDAQAREVISWLRRSPCDFGFVTERWTAPRVTTLIERLMGVRMNHRY